MITFPWPAVDLLSEKDLISHPAAMLDGPNCKDQNTSDNAQKTLPVQF